MHGVRVRHPWNGPIRLTLLSSVHFGRRSPCSYSNEYSCQQDFYACKSVTLIPIRPEGPTPGLYANQSCNSTILFMQNTRMQTLMFMTLYCVLPIRTRKEPIPALIPPNVTPYPGATYCAVYCFYNQKSAIYSYVKIIKIFYLTFHQSDN